MEEMDAETRRQYLAEFDAQHRRAIMHFLSTLTQKSSVADLQMEVEELTQGVTGLFEPLVASYFVSGLRPEIRRELLCTCLWPTTREEAFTLARACEARIEVRHSDSHLPIVSPVSPDPAAPLAPSPPPLSDPAIPPFSIISTPLPSATSDHNDPSPSPPQPSPNQAPSLTTTPPPPSQQPSPVTHSTSLSEPLKPLTPIQTPVISSDSLPPIVPPSIPTPDPLPYSSLSLQIHPPLDHSSQEPLPDSPDQLDLEPDPQPSDLRPLPPSLSIPRARSSILFSNPIYPPLGAPMKTINSSSSMLSILPSSTVPFSDLFPLSKPPPDPPDPYPCDKIDAVVNAGAKEIIQEEEFKETMNEDVFVLYQAMVDAGVSSSTTTCNSLAMGLCKKGRLCNASKLLDKMVQSGVCMNISAFTIFWDACCRLGAIDGATKCGNGMKMQWIKSNVITNTLLLSRWVTVRRIDHADWVFDEMLHKTNVTFSSKKSVKFLGMAPRQFQGAIEAVKKLRKDPEDGRIVMIAKDLKFLYDISETLKILQLKKESQLREFYIPDYIFEPGLEVEELSYTPQYPVVVFINSRSGDQLGGDLLITYQKLLIKVQILDLGEEAPDKRFCTHFKHWMGRKNVMANVPIYKAQVSALEAHATANCKVFSVANAANNFFKSMTVLATTNMLLSSWIRVKTIGDARKVINKLPHKSILSHLTDGFSMFMDPAGGQASKTLDEVHKSADAMKIFSRTVFLGRLYMDSPKKIRDHGILFGDWSYRILLPESTTSVGEQKKAAKKVLAEIPHKSFRTCHLNSFTSVTVFISSTGLQASKTAEFNSNHFVETTLLDTYATGGNVTDSCAVIAEMINPTLISDNGIFSAFVPHDFFEDSLLLLKQMQVFGAEPNSISLFQFSHSCIGHESLEWCQSGHAYMVKAGLNSQVPVMNVFLEMYLSLGGCEVGIRVDYVKKLITGTDQMDIANFVVSSAASHRVVFLQKQNYFKACFVLKTLTAKVDIKQGVDPWLYKIYEFADAVNSYSPTPQRQTVFFFFPSCLWLMRSIRMQEMQLQASN